MRRPLLVAAAAVVLVAGGTAAVAASSSGDVERATCTANPAVTGKTVAAFDVHCSVTRVAPTATVTATQTVTATATVTQTVTASPSSPAPTTTTPTGDGWQSAGIPSGTTLTRVPQDAMGGAGWTADSAGNVTVTTAGATLTGLDIAGKVYIKAAGVTVTNSKVRCIGESDWCVEPINNARLTMTHDEIGGGADGHTYTYAIAVLSSATSLAAPNTFDHVLIHHQVHGMRVDGGTIVRDSWITDLPMGDSVLIPRTGGSTTDAHSDGIMSTRGGGVLIQGNRIDGGTTAHPCVEWSITVAEEQAARIPVHSTKLWREVNGRMGYYAGHVYRDCLVETIPLKPWLLYLAAVDDATEDTYYGDLRTGAITMAPPSDAFYTQPPADGT